eukprot:TRINITY_DN5830_c0_g1_i1.p1 TRINITY_DN5830_c0_g1~~TRINITY_DN5830_c0_g1_i1.p1  ORF type:complete len:1144 (-),score=329.28 TRINITY_DN5830_c0_g1_i1:370-3801(-)
MNSIKSKYTKERRINDRYIESSIDNNKYLLNIKELIGHKEDEKIENELDLLIQLDHPHILKFIEKEVIIDSWEVSSTLNIISEHCFASIKEYLLSYEFQFSEAQISEISYQTLKGLKYIHKNNIIHNNLKSENILITRDGKIKISDFSHADVVQSKYIENDQKEPKGTPHFVAPERVFGGKYDFSSDIWSFGIFLLELAEGYPPLRNETPIKAMMLIGSRKYDPLSLVQTSQTYSKEFASILEKCLQFDPTFRATAASLLKDYFVESGKDTNLLSDLYNIEIDRVNETFSKYQKQVIKDDQGNTLQIFTTKIITWKKQNIDFFDILSSNQKTETLIKELKESTKFEFNSLEDNKKWETSLFNWQIVLEFCQFVTSEAFGVIIYDRYVGDKVYKRALVGFDFVNWTVEMLELEAREIAKNLAKVLLKAEILIPATPVFMDNIDTNFSLYSFNANKLITIQKKSMINNSWNFLMSSDSSGDLISTGENTNLSPRLKENKQDIKKSFKNLGKKSIQEEKEKTSDSVAPILVNDYPLIVETPYYVIELGDDNSSWLNPKIEFEKNYVPTIKSTFSGLPYTLYVSKNENNNNNSFVMVEDVPEVIDENAKRKVLVVSGDPFSKSQYEIPMRGKDEKEILSVTNLKEINKMNIEMREEIFDFEEKMLRNFDKYKFGVIYLKEDQVADENSIFQNNVTTPAFEKFLSQLGEKIKLKGWKDYAGCLNTTEDSTGEYSYFANFDRFKIMFHVTTLLPDDKFDEQRIAKKKHTGNDVVVVVFCESKDVKFSPKIFTSQFNHVFIVVSIDRIEEGEVYYRVAVVTKNGVKETSPKLPHTPVFKEGPKFTKFLLTKLINSERASMYAPDFYRKLVRTRKTLLGEIAKQLNEKINEKSEKGKNSSIVEKKGGSGFGLSNDPVFKQSESDTLKSNSEGISEFKKLDWIESLSVKEWEYINVIGKEKEYGNNEIIAKATDDNKAFIRIIRGRVKETVGGKIIRQMEKNTFGTHYGLLNPIRPSIFMSHDFSTVVNRLDLVALHHFFESHSLIGKKFYQNVCLMLITSIRKLSRNFVKMSTNPLLNDTDISLWLKETKDVLAPSSENKSQEEEQKTTKFISLFGLPSSETLLMSVPCKYKKIIKIFGTLYVSPNYVCFV